MGIFPMGTPGRLPTVASYPLAIQPGIVTYPNQQQPAFYSNTQTAPFPTMSQPVFGNNGTLGTQQFAPPPYSNMSNTYSSNPSRFF